MIFLQGNVPSLKNSKIKTDHGIFASKTVVKYLRNLGIQQYSSGKKLVKGFVTKPNLFASVFTDWNKPTEQIILGFHFVRGSKHKFDFNNATQILLDLMVAHDFLEDDCMDYVIPQCLWIEGRSYSYDKNNAGVYIDIIN